MSSRTRSRFDVQGLRAEAIQPVGIRFTRDDATAFVALGPANRVAVIDTKTYKVKKYLLVGQRVWQMAFTPDDKYLLTTNGLSNDVSVIDVAALKVVKSIPVGPPALGRGGVAEMSADRGPALPTAPARATAAALAVNGVSHAYGARKALEDVSLSVPQARFTVLLGLNGAGKTTLFSLITRLYDTRHGSIEVLGPSRRRANRARRCGCSAWCSRRARSISTFR